MVKLIKKIEGELLKSIECSVNMSDGISGIIQNGDYINVYGFEAYLQNYTKVEKEIESLQKPLIYGLPNKYKLDVQTIEIDY